MKMMFWDLLIKIMSPLETAEIFLRGSNRLGVFPPHLRKETVSETSCFLFSRIPDDGKNPKTQ
jgi:hypothetical protein